MFINRKKELAFLNQLAREKKPTLLILYGRRRVGKSALLVEFAKKNKALYLLARQGTEKDQLSKLSEEIALFFNDAVLQQSPFANYDALFLYLLEKRTQVIFDEFPFLVESNKALPSILQNYWDQHFSKNKSCIILCGSSISMMESLLGYKSPLYGRRTEQLLLEPLSFDDARKFFPKKSSEQAVEAYAVLGGTPAYLLDINHQKLLLEQVKERILAKNTFLSQDVLFVLREELKEPRTYFSILKAIAHGNTRLGTIMSAAGFERGVITKYLEILKSLHLIERRVPITEKHPEKSRKGIYKIKDNYVRFWFRFVYENREYIEQGKQEKLIAEKIKPQFDAYVGEAFEEICLEWVKRTFPHLSGRWWDKEHEIDIVGLDQDKVLLGEVKWKALNEKEARREYGKLKEKAKLFDTENPQLIIIAKKIESKESLRKEGLEMYDFQDVVGSD
ncbi:ATP-binding protein [Candidatus Woesearchaeota archaeon]|nr:ATP-binding protein [Candidatus Woesearchaeota archaeon]